MVEKDEWMQLEQTKKLITYLNTNIESMAEAMAYGACFGESPEQTAMNYSRKVGIIESYLDILDYIKTKDEVTR